MTMRISSAGDADTALLIDLVSTMSISGSEHLATQRFVSHAVERGFTAEIDSAGNACAHRGRHDADTHIVMLGHIDTVPGDIPVRVSDGVLHGRGSVDAKGPLCAMLCAAEHATLPSGVRLSVIGAVGEEITESPGARFLVKTYRPDACIIGEPSGWDGVTLGYKGRLIARATAECPNHHSAGSDASAGDAIFAWWQRVTEHVIAFNADPRGAFDSLQATLQDLGYFCDGLQQYARLDVGFRLPPALHPDTVADWVAACARDPVTVGIVGTEVAHQTSRNDPVVRSLSSAIRSAGGRPRPKLKTGTADFNVVGPAWNCPIAAYGPGDSSLDHTPTERLVLDEYHRSINVLRHALETLAVELTEVG